MVANGEKLTGSGVCNDVVLKCQGCIMEIYSLLFPLNGCQVVLGAKPMKSLGEITLNLDRLQVKFVYNDKPYVWQGLK